MDIPIQLARNIGFQKLGTRLRLLLLLLLRLPQPRRGDSGRCIIYSYILSKPNNEEITSSTIGYRRLNTIILWTFSSEWCFEGRCWGPGLIVEHKRIISGHDGHKPDCQHIGMFSEENIRTFLHWGDYIGLAFVLKVQTSVLLRVI